MCGIAGIWGRIDRARMAEMLALLRHRGPDGEGVWIDPGAELILGHRRLAIIDIAGGAQPMTTADGSVTITFNGEIYNYVELARSLESRGHALRTRSDTETILGLYVEHGAGFVEHLRGMFALALWDADRRELLLARDRMGKKPLYYSEAGGVFTFASEIPAVVAALGGRVDVDDQALADYLAWGMVPAPATIYRQIRAVPAACLMRVRDGRVVAAGAVGRRESSPGGAPSGGPHRPYWRVEPRPKRTCTVDTAVELLDRALHDAVRIRLRAAVAVGAFLSGGIDSGLVTAIAAHHAAGPLRTVTIGHADRAVDERPLARLVAERYGTDHHEEILEPGQAQGGLIMMVRAFGQPYANTSAIPNHAVARVARTQRKVVLTGDGGDEILAGYRRYVAARMGAALGPLAAGPRARRAWRAIASALPNPGVPRSPYGFAHRLVAGLGHEPAVRHMAWSVDLFDAEDLAALCGDRAWHRDVAPGQRIAEALLAQYAAAGAGALDRMMAVDARTLLPDNLNLKLDVCTMQHGLEARSPLLDHVLVDIATRLPERVKLSGAATKPLLRRLARRYLPEAVCTAEKRGFEVPVAAWLDGELRELRDDLLRSPSGFLRDRFDPAALAALAACPPAQRPRNWPHRVICLMVLGLWARSAGDWAGAGTKAG